MNRYFADRRFLSSLLALLFALSPIGPHAVGAVLCIESDGTFGFEGRRGGMCGAPNHVAESVNEHEAIGHDDGENHCVDCVDVAIAGGLDSDCQALKTSDHDFSVFQEPPTRTLDILRPSEFVCNRADRGLMGTVLMAGFAPASLSLLI